MGYSLWESSMAHFFSIFTLKHPFIVDFSIATFDSRRVSQNLSFQVGELFYVIYPGGMQIPYDLGNQGVTENFQA